MNKGVCKFCGGEKELIKAHIIPRNFYINYKQDKYRSVDLNTGKWEQRQCGAYDKNILCSDCDNGVFKKFDDEGYRILLQECKNHTEKNYNNSILYHFKKNDFNYLLLRKFFISILWRASISNIEEFKFVNLGKYEELAKQILLGNSNNENLFNVIIFKSPNNKKFNKIVSIQKGRFYSATTYTIFMASFNIVVIINASGLPLTVKNIFNQLFLSENELYILETEEIYEDKMQYFYKIIKKGKSNFGKEIKCKV